MTTNDNTPSLKSRNIMLILNPVAGRGQAIRQLPDLTHAFEREGCQVTSFMTNGKGDATRIVTEYANRFDRIVCLGGDGTLNEVATGVIHANCKVPVGYIPTGSTNDFARSHKLSHNVSLAVREITEATGRPMDVGKMNDRYFVYVAAFGAFTRASYSTPQEMKNILGYAAYVLSGIRDVSNIKPLHIQLTSGKEVHEGDYCFGAVCNTLSMAGFMSLPTDSVAMDDGIFEVLLCRMPENVLEWPPLLHALANQDYSYKGIEFFHSGEFVIETEKPMEWSLDGEYACEGPAIQVKNLHRVLVLAADDPSSQQDSAIK
jgi:YegS/Rv2252/BmrU family lipid kinase